MRHVLFALSFAAFLPGTALAGVLGPCGTDQAETPGAAVAPAPAAATTPALAVQSIPLPGARAPNFELPAVVGDEVRTVKLSDYDGKWRVVCFYPADFTFV